MRQLGDETGASERAKSYPTNLRCAIDLDIKMQTLLIWLSCCLEDMGTGIRLPRDWRIVDGRGIAGNNVIGIFILSD